MVGCVFYTYAVLRMVYNRDRYSVAGAIENLIPTVDNIRLYVDHPPNISPYLPKSRCFIGLFTKEQARIVHEGRGATNGVWAGILIHDNKQSI